MSSVRSVQRFVMGDIPVAFPPLPETVSLSEVLPDGEIEEEDFSAPENGVRLELTEIFHERERTHRLPRV